MATVQASCLPPISGAAHVAERYPPKEVTPLANACVSGDFDSVQKIFESYLTNRSHENHELHEFWPVLLTAVAHNRPKIVSHLLDLGLPLVSMHVEQAIKTKSTAIFDVFLQHGWNINKQLSETKPPALAFVVEDWEITNWFLNHGANPNAGCRLDLNPMSFAVRKASLQIINLLFDRGGDAERGQLIHHAIERDENVIDVLNLLLQKGASLNARMYENHQPSWNLQYYKGLGTALHRATELGKTDIACYLIQNGVDPSLQDSKARTALDCARHYNHPEIIRLLQSS